MKSNKFGVWSIECSLIVSIAPFGPTDLGSNPGWFAVSNSASTVTVQLDAPLYLVINIHLRMQLQIWRRSTHIHNANRFIWIVEAHGTWISHQKILYWLDQRNAKWKRTIRTLKILSKALFFIMLISGNMGDDTNILKIHPNGKQQPILF